MEDELLDFTKSGKGLGDLYENDKRNALKKANPDLFLDEEFGPIKKEIEDIF